jgi:uncharacterized integral membrane protein (TIGR00697 family)
MPLQILQSRATKLFIALCAFFVANALIAECIGGKLFSLEALLGIAEADFSFFGQSGLSFVLTCGVLLWPLEFVMTDVVNEYFGMKAVKRITYITIILIAYAFIAFYLAMGTPSAAFWVSSQQHNNVPDMDSAFNAIFGQGLFIIVGSLVAFLVSQIVDVFVFQYIKRKTGNKMVWLRATGSTVVSQLVDSFIVLFIAFKIGNDWSIQRVLAICLMNYTYKFIMAILLTPAIYGLHFVIDKYLGKDLAEKMKTDALGE